MILQAVSSGNQHDAEETLPLAAIQKISLNDISAQISHLKLDIIGAMKQMHEDCSARLDKIDRTLVSYNERITSLETKVGSKLEHEFKKLTDTIADKAEEFGQVWTKFGQMKISDRNSQIFSENDFNMGACGTEAFHSSIVEPAPFHSSSMEPAQFLENARASYATNSSGSSFNNSGKGKK